MSEMDVTRNNVKACLKCSNTFKCEIMHCGMVQNNVLRRLLVDKKLKETDGKKKEKQTKTEKSPSVPISHVINTAYIDTAVMDHYDAQRSAGSMPQTHLLFFSEQKLCGKKIASAEEGK